MKIVNADIQIEIVFSPARLFIKPFLEKIHQIEKKCFLKAQIVAKLLT